MEAYYGKKYLLKDSENFEDYLVFIGIGYFARKIALKLSQTNILSYNGDGTYTFEFISPLARSSATFRSGEEFEEETADGTKVKSVITIEGNIMTHIQVDDNGKTSKHVREFYEDRMVVTTTAEGLDITAKRYYVVIE